MSKLRLNFFVTIIISAIVIFSNIMIAQDKLSVPKPELRVQRIAGLNAGFIVALIPDGRGDNNGYALAIDKLGRLWVGHLNTRVSVFNGKDWKNYDVVDGPIGERIFDIKICPKDGDVWIATSAGITRYKIDSDTWEHLIRKI
jgi:ligand-binding sensor domain-containing protein